MKKNQIIISTIIIILIFGGIISWNLLYKEEIPVKELVSDKEEIVFEEELQVPLMEPAAEESVFGLTAWVLGVDAKNNFLIIKSERNKKELKVFVSDDTELIKRDLPDDLPENGYFIFQDKKIKLSDFKEGDYIAITTSENIAGKTEFNNVINIRVYFK